jgi:hypothetical protein
MKDMRAFLEICCAILIGCGASPEGEELPEYPERPICDGSDGFTLQIAGVSSAWNDSPFGILWRNGFNYLRITGDCTFYVFGQRRNEPILTGSLNEADARRLANETSYAAWPALNGLSAAGSLVDGALIVLSDGQNEMVCAEGCRDHPLPADRDAARRLGGILDAADAWRARLLGIGTPVVGSVRFAIAKRPSIPHVGAYLEWPLPTPIESYAVDRTIGVNSPDYVPITTGYLAEGSDAAALRALRQRAVETRVPDSSTEGWIVIAAPNGEAYEVVVGDVLPFEDADGLVPRKFSR